MTQDLLQHDQERVWHPFTPLVGAPTPIVITKGEGVYLHTADGRKIIDAVSSWWVNIHGHSHPVIADAIYKQALNLEHVIFAGFTHEPAITLAGNLLSILPANQSKIFFSDNGSTAVEVALKMALQYWHNLDKPRTKIIALDGAYHGDTFGAMAVGERGIFTKPFHSLLFDVEVIDFPSATNEDEVLTQFKQKVATNDVAAFVYEPLVQGASGMRIYSATLLEKLLQLAKQHHVICIADEVFTGFGRTGKLFASHYCVTPPDIMAVSKGITGGFMPLGVTSCSKEIAAAFESDDALKTFFHGHSYTANPLACAAANASFGLLMADSCQQRITRISEWHQKFVERHRNNKALVSIKSLGTILSIELKTEESTAYLNSLRKRIYPYFLERQILLRPLGNVVYVLPPYCITDDQLLYVYRSIEEFLNEVV